MEIEVRKVVFCQEKNRSWLGSANCLALKQAAQTARKAEPSSQRTKQPKKQAKHFGERATTSDLSGYMRASKAVPLRLALNQAMINVNGQKPNFFDAPTYQTYLTLWSKGDKTVKEIAPKKSKLEEAMLA